MRHLWTKLAIPAHALGVAGILITLVALIIVRPQADPDLDLYHAYAQRFWLSSPPLTALPQEYPILALAPFSLTLFDSGVSGHIAFEVSMALLALCGYLMLRRWVAPDAALWYLLYLLLGAQVLVMIRFDIVPMLCTLGAYLCAMRRRYLPAYILLALGVLLKLYPIFLLPIALIEQWRYGPTLWASPATDARPRPTLRVSRLSPNPSPSRDGGRRSAYSSTASVSNPRFRGPSFLRVLRVPVPFILIALGFAFAYWRNPHDAFALFHFATQRPAQIESLAAALAWGASYLSVPAHVTEGFGGVNLVGPLADLLAQWSTFAMLAGLVSVYWRYWRGKLALSGAFLVVIGVLLLTNKVFSTQYLIWIIPFAALWGRDRLLWAAICALTTLDLEPFYPFANAVYTSADVTRFMLVVALRNVLLVVAVMQALTAHVLEPESQIAMPSIPNPEPISVME